MNTGALPARAARAPLMMYLHNEPPDWFYPAKPTMLGVRSLDWLLTPSEYIREKWIDAGIDPGRASVIPYGVDPARFKPASDDERAAARAANGLGQDDIVIAYVGRLEEIKGVHLLIDAFNRYYSEEPRARLLLVGGLGNSIGAAGEPYVARLRGLASPERTVWWGVTDDSASVMRLCDVIVIPSLWQEPSAVSSVEGLMTGVVTLVSRSGGMPDHFQGGLEDLVFDQGSSDAILEKLRAFGDWRRVSPQLGPTIRQHALATRTLEASVTKTENLMEQLIAEQRSR